MESVENLGTSPRLAKALANLRRTARVPRAIADYRKDTIDH